MSEHKAIDVYAGMAALYRTRAAHFREIAELDLDSPTEVRGSGWHKARAAMLHTADCWDAEADRLDPIAADYVREVG